jgi:2-polyprenyl-6-methoxyphenol hydroxylase-like FAD-dependent oxidoreductase
MALSTISVPESGTNEITAHFADGTSFEGSLLIGCDGARSHVRELLCPTSFQTHQLPVRLLGVSVVFPTAVAKPLRDLDPYFMQAGDKREDLFLWFSCKSKRPSKSTLTLILHLVLDGPSNNDRPEKESYTCQILISWPLRPPQLPEVPASAADRVALMKRLSSEWSDPFKSIIAAIPDDAQPVTLKLEDWPPPLQPGVQNGGWDNLGGRVTLAGDAAHAMTMYRGEVFNHALRDLQVLVENIAPVYKTSVEEAGGTGEWSKILKDAVDRYEKEMCARGRPAVLASRRACLDAHEQGRIGPNSPLVARRVMRIEELEGME